MCLCVTAGNRGLEQAWALPEWIIAHSDSDRGCWSRNQEPIDVRFILHNVRYSLQCAVERRAFLVGAKPTQQLSFRLVAARAVHGGNDMG